MANFHKLDPDTRCLALVGRYLQRWAMLEGTIREALAVLMNLNSVSMAVVATNMQARDKVYTLRTFIDMSLLLTEEEKQTYDKVCTSILDAVPNRNMIAHNMFYPERDGDGEGVYFFIVKARGSFKVPPTVWRLDRFETEFTKLQRLTESLETLRDIVEERCAQLRADPLATHVPKDWPTAE